MANAGIPLKLRIQRTGQAEDNAAERNPNCLFFRAQPAWLAPMWGGRQLPLAVDTG